MFRAYFFLLMHLTKRVPFLWILSQTGDFVCLRSYKRRGKTSEATCSDVFFFLLLSPEQKLDYTV